VCGARFRPDWQEQSMRRDGGRQLVGVLCAPPLQHQNRLQGSGLAVGFRVEDLGELRISKYFARLLRNTRLGFRV
jgi:hypothetical protein